MRALDVYLHGNLAGQLVLRDNGLTAFQYDERWLGRTDAMPLSLSLPLRRQRFPHRDCMPFFGGVLPEGRNRRLIAGILGVSEGNDFALLERLAGECAGAVALLPEGTLPVAQDERTRELDQKELARLLHELGRRPLLVGTEGLRLSLAGAQDKLPVRIKDTRVLLPLGTAPTTHILKPAGDDFEGIVFNEAFCLALAHAVGLPTTEYSVGRVGDSRLPGPATIRSPNRWRGRDQDPSGGLLPSPGRSLGTQIPGRGRAKPEAVFRPAPRRFRRAGA